MKGNIYDLVNKYTLKFLDKNLEAEYESELELKFQNDITLYFLLRFFIVLTLIQISYLIIRILMLATVNLKYLNLTIEIITLGSFVSSFGLEILLFFSGYLKFLRGFFIKIIGFLCSFLYMNYYNHSDVMLLPIWFPIIVISILIVQIIFCRKMLQSVIQFICTGIAAAILLVFSRKVPLIEYFELMIMGIFALIGWSGFCYFFEISFRNDFYKIYVSKKMNKALKNLFQQMPIPFLILKKEKFSKQTIISKNS